MSATSWSKISYRARYWSSGTETCFCAQTGERTRLRHFKGPVVWSGLPSLRWAREGGQVQHRRPGWVHTGRGVGVRGPQLSARPWQAQLRAGGFVIRHRLGAGCRQSRLLPQQARVRGGPEAAGCAWYKGWWPTSQALTCLAGAPGIQRSSFPRRRAPVLLASPHSLDLEVGKVEERDKSCKRAQTSSYKMSTFWGSNVKRDQ